MFLSSLMLPLHLCLTIAFVLVPNHGWSPVSSPFLQFDLVTFPTSPVLEALGRGAMIDASDRVRFYFLSDGFFRSSSLVDPASSVIDMSQESMRTPAVSLPKVDGAQMVKISLSARVPNFPSC